VHVIPAIDLERGRSRLVYWPGAGAGIGAPTDRPDRIAERFVALGARLIHLVDFDGARAGAPANLDTVGAVAARVAVPLQVAGGVDSAEGIQLAFAAGATRVVLTTAIADRPDDLRACLAVAGDWLAVGLDPRPDRIAAFPWRGGPGSIPSLAELIDRLADLGVRRFVLTHGGSSPDPETLRRIVESIDAEVLVAGGVPDLDGLRALRDAGVDGVILGQPLLSGAIEYSAALEAAA
jgi:phosphoribosylformimino-5-aminoimidazole carboxamide ribotide isomerase